jgi:hypothetical protein
MRQVLAMAVVALLSAGCVSTAPSPLPVTPSLSTGTPTGPTLTAPGSTSAATSRPTPTPEPAAGVHGLAAVQPPGFDGAILNAVVSFGGQFLAAGSFGGQSGEPRRAAVWGSPDGRSWTRVPDADAFAATFPTFGGLPGAGGIDGLAAGGSGVVGVGGTGEWGTTARAAAWQSADGQVWRRSLVAGSTSAFMLDVAAGGPGFVAIGAAGIVDPRPYQETQVYPTGAVWVSVDGATWTRLDTGKVFANGIPTRIVTLPSGVLVASGLDKRSLQQCSNCFGGSYLLWASADGRTWSRLPELTLPALATDAAEVRSDLIADGPRILHWRAEGIFASTDAKTWVSFAPPPTEEFADQAPSSLFAIDGGLLAIGPTSVSDNPDGSQFVATTWTWTPTGSWGPPAPIAIDPPLPGWPSFNGTATLGDVIVMVGDLTAQRGDCECYPMSFVLRGTVGG